MPIKKVAFYIIKEVMEWELPKSDEDIYAEDELEESIAEKLARLEAVTSQ
ncbi:MAG: hypothetical protein GY749_38175 [Desulfobacteraceae bacterium]|nr:hypothetical protein [Desulfobacteraceae bacterium]